MNSVEKFYPSKTYKCHVHRNTLSYKHICIITIQNMSPFKQYARSLDKMLPGYLVLLIFLQRLMYLLYVGTEFHTAYHTAIAASSI